MIIAGISISIFLTALLLFKKNKRIADIILLAWFVLITIHQLFYFLKTSGYTNQFPSLIAVHFPFPLMHGPFLFLYASALVGNVPHRKYLDLLHFIPVVLCYIYLIPFFLLPGDQKIIIMANHGAGYELFNVLRFYSIIISGVVYVILTLILLNRHQRKIKDQFSDIEQINLKWLQYLSYGIGIIWLTVILGTEDHTFLAVVIFVMVIGFFGIKQTPIFTSNHPTNYRTYTENTEDAPVDSEKDAAILDEAQKRYETSGLSQNKKEAIADDLKNVLKKKRYISIRNYPWTCWQINCRFIPTIYRNI